MANSYWILEADQRKLTAVSLYVLVLSYTGLDSTKHENMLEVGTTCTM